MISIFNSKKKKKQYKDISLVLSGGGARGFGHIGVIEVLEENGYHIHSVTGTSMGALIGGLYALGKLDEFKEWITKMNKFQAFDLIDLSISRRGLLKGNRVYRKMKKHFPTQNIEDLSINFCAIATKLYAKEIVKFQDGDLYDAIKASGSIPGVFSPVQVDDDLYVDGGILNNLPLEHAKRKKKDLLVAVDVNAFIPYEGEKQKIKNINSNINIFSHSLSLLIEANAKNSLKTVPPDILVQLSRDACDLLDFFKVKDQIEYGRERAKLTIETFLKDD